MKDYWYFVYAWRRPGDMHWNYSDKALDYEPLKWVVETRQKYSEGYYIVHAHKISEADYRRYKDEVG